MKKETEKTSHVIDRIECDLNKAIDLVFETFDIPLDKTAVPYIIGKPGGGKTQMISKKAHDKNYGFLSYEPALERIEKFGGIPDLLYQPTKDSYVETIELPNITNGDTSNIKTIPTNIKRNHKLITVWSIPEMIEDIQTACDKHEKVIVLFDDWHLCPAEIQQIGFELFTYHSFTGVKIPKNARFILAGNESSSAGSQIQLTAIRNRCFVLYTRSTPEYWIENYAEPNNILDIGISYFNNRDHWAYFHEEESTNEQFGSPRSWTYLFNLIDHIIKTNKQSKKTIQSIIPTISQGFVSRKAVSSFCTYYELFSNIDVKSLLHNGIIQIPENRIEQFAYITAMTSELYSIVASNFDTNLVNTACGNYLKLLDAFVSSKSKNSELCICCIKQLNNKVEIPSLHLPSGKSVLTKLIRDNRTSVALLEELRKMASMISTGD